MVREYTDPAGRSPFEKWFSGLEARAAAKVTQEYKVRKKVERCHAPDTGFQRDHQGAALAERLRQAFARGAGHGLLHRTPQKKPPEGGLF